MKRHCNLCGKDYWHVKSQVGAFMVWLCVHCLPQGDLERRIKEHR